MVVQMCADVVTDHPSMLLIAVLGALYAAGWSMLCFVAYFGVFHEYKDEIFQNEDYTHDPHYRYVVYSLYFVACLIFIWGVQVATNTAHVAFCGVYGRHYYAKDEEENPMMPSLRAAFLTSYGSVCFGSFLVAVINAAEMVARKMMDDQAKEGNIVTCIIR